MLEHLTQETIKAYQSAALSAAELLAVDHHISSCELCKQRLFDKAAQKQLSSLLMGLKSTAAAALEHLGYEQLEEYSNEKVDQTQREIIESHLLICPQCADEAHDLIACRDSLVVQKKTISPVIPMPAVSLARDQSMIVKETFSPPSFFTAIKSLFTIPAYRFAMQSAMAIIIIVLAVWLLILPLRNKISELQAQVHRLEEENAGLQQNDKTLVELQNEIAALKQEKEDLQQASGTDLPDKSLVLQDAGSTISLDEAGNLEGLNGLSAANKQVILNALQNQRVDVPSSLASVTTKAGVLMSGNQTGVSFALVGPIGTFTQSARPVFRWHELKGATAYVVTIYDAAFTPVARSEELKKMEWTPPLALNAGVIYRWQVTATTDGKQIKSPVPPAPEARFKIVEPMQIAKLNRIKQDSLNSHLVLGVFYTQAGLIDDAERELQALVLANPKSQVARRLLQIVKAKRK